MEILHEAVGRIAVGVAGLPLPMLELSEALLDFTSVDDLQAWLDERLR